MAGGIECLGLGSSGFWARSGPVLRHASRADDDSAMGVGGRTAGEPNVGVYCVRHRRFRAARGDLFAASRRDLCGTAEGKYRLTASWNDGAQSLRLKD